MAPVTISRDGPATFVTGRPPAPGMGTAILIAEWLLLLICIGYVGMRIVPRAWHHLNTDFPNYYVTATLLRDGQSASRAYEWVWLQRQKDHLGIHRTEQPLVGFIPHTPFSALLVWPTTYWSPLTAKHIWIVFNLLLLAVTLFLLQSLVHLPWRRLALLFVTSYPLLRNFEYGQYYLVILLLLTLGLWLYVRHKSFASGAVVGVACALKVFPVLFALYFLRKRDLTAAAGLAMGAVLSTAAAIATFGIGMHRIYLTQILPWALRGEAMDPYNAASNSLSALLHKLFIFEPQWNPAPLLHIPAAYAVVQPILQMLVLAPAIYLSLPRNNDPQRLQIEWSAYIVALLAISTLPASYHFALLILPVAIVVAVLLRENRTLHVGLLLIGYIGVCYPAWPRLELHGLWALLSVPRLYFMLLLCALFYVPLARCGAAAEDTRQDRTAWTILLTALLVVQSFTLLRHQRGAYNYAGRILTSSDVLMAAHPISDGIHLYFTAMLWNRYETRENGLDTLPRSIKDGDQFSQAAIPGSIWVEESGETERITSTGPGQMEIKNAEEPLLSPDGAWLAYLRTTRRGSSRLWMHNLHRPFAKDYPVTPEQFDVEEATFVTDKTFVFSATDRLAHSALYLISESGAVTPLLFGEARYPAASPDGRWLAYSHLEHGGSWNLWLRDMATGATKRLTSADCNDVSPSWEIDSKTLLYASDCGRALGFTALYRRPVLP